MSNEIVNHRNKVLTMTSKSLADLNLRGNRIVEVRNVHRLPQLRYIDLGKTIISIYVSALANIPQMTIASKRFPYSMKLRIAVKRYVLSGYAGIAWCHLTWAVTFLG